MRVGPDQESDTLVPVAVQTSGVASTDWRTELALFNSGDTALTVRFTFLPGAGGPTAERSMTIAPQETLAYFNTLPDLFGIPAGAGGLLIESSSGTGADSQLRISSRTFTMSEAGTFGQFVNIQDITALLNGSTAAPPMFGGTRAFNKTCPWSP